MKWLVLLIITILIVPLVNAFTILGEEASLLVLIPFALIIISLVIFAVMIIKDKIKSKSIEKGLELEKIPETEPENIPSDIQKEEKPLDEIDYKKEVKLLEQKLPSSRTKDINNSLFRLIRQFFFNNLGIKYNFTFEELEKELQKNNKKIKCFAKNLSTINYCPKGASKDDLKQLIKEFKEVVSSTVEDVAPEFKDDFKEKEKKLNELLKKGGKTARKDIGKAREQYKEIFEIYKRLPDNEKRKLKPTIMNFYKKLA